MPHQDYGELDRAKDELISRLREYLPDFREVIEEGRKRVHLAERAATLRSYNQEDVRVRLIIDAKVFRDTEALVSKHWDKHFGFLTPLTAHEFVKVTFQQVGGVATNNELWSQQCDRALDLLQLEAFPTQLRCYGGKGIDVGAVRIFSGAAVDDCGSLAPIEIWKHRDNFRLELDCGAELYSEGLLTRGTVKVLGWASRQAFDEIVTRLSPIVNAVLQIARLTTTPDVRYGNEFGLTDESLACMQLVCRACIDALSKPENERATLDNQLVIAVTLFQEALHQPLPAVGIMLCFAAIEALVSERRQQPAECVKAHVPVLLSRNTTRWNDARWAVQKLYDLRSQLAHGGRTEAPEEVFHIAKKLAAGAIRSASSWHEYCEKAGGHSDLFQELWNCARDSRTMIVGPDLSDLLPWQRDIQELLGN